ncbi:MAG: type IV secretory system conjugative DNA transfer family protein [Candidatus Kerfeldbacteria bacterium]|nr:type IV secretory system conjugative DNA transfer family protein [Candidatus Kerfeldbacteria bacterium]
MEKPSIPEGPPIQPRREQPGEQPEHFPASEQPEQRPGQAQPAPAERPAPAPVPTPLSPVPPGAKSSLVLEIEHILAEDLQDVYVRLSPEDQERFRREGEEVATRIGRLIEQVKLKTKSILNLIRGWLKLIPGVNRFFLEQEAKIKADQVIALAQKKRGQRLHAVLQLGLSVGPSASASDGADGLLEQPIVQLILLGVLAIGVAVAVIALIRLGLRRSNKLPLSLQLVILRVLVPKEAGTKEGQPAPDPKELLAAAETLYLNLGNIRPEQGRNVLHTSWLNFWHGRNDQLSLEIVSQKGLIVFYLAVPRHLQRLVEQQVHAQYDKAHIEEVEDYNIFSPQGKIVGTYLGLSRRSMFQIRTYRKLDADPLNAVTNTLSKLGPEEGVAIQYVIRPARKGWRAAGQRVARLVQHGKNFNEAMAAVGGGGWSAVGKVSGSIFSSFKTKSQEEELKKTQVPPSLTPMDQELVKSLEEKASKYGFDVNLRVVVSAPTQEQARSTLMNVVNAFSQYTSQESNTGFQKKPTLHKARFVHDFIFRHFHEGMRFVLNSEELTSVYHLPLPTTETPNILWLAARKAPAPVNVPTAGLVLGLNRYRGVDTTIRIAPDDRRRHVYIIGMTGVGKSVLMEEMAKQDIREGRGVCVVDPHGSLVDAVIGAVPKERAEDVILFDPSDTVRPLGLNMLEADTPEERDFAVQEMIAIFYKLFPPEMIGPMFEHNMRNAMLTLMEDREYPGTITDVPRIFTDKAFQRYKLAKVTDPIVRAFWEKEMAKTSDFHKSEMLGYLISKVGRFVENAMMRNIIGQPRSGFDFREVMDKEKILLVNLSKGKVGEVNASLLGLIIVSKLQMAALARASQPEAERKDFYLYIDEFQNFITDSIATILSEARKYRLNLTMAHQYMGQLSPGGDTKVRDAVLGNVGTKIAFRIGVEDAEVLAKEFAPVFDAYDLVNQERFNAYVKLLINNSVGKAFHLQTFPPSPTSSEVARAIRELSHLKYGRDRAEVEADILERSQLGGVSGAAQPPSLEPRQ